MKPSGDWREALGALKANLSDLPAGDDDSVADSGIKVEEKTPRQKLRIDMERKGRGGKTATIISGFTLSDEQLAQVAATLKKRLGTGGSARCGEILIQGDRRDDVRRALMDMGLM